MPCLDRTTAAPVMLGPLLSSIRQARRFAQVCLTPASALQLRQKEASLGAKIPAAVLSDSGTVVGQKHQLLAAQGRRTCLAAAPTAAQCASGIEATDVAEELLKERCLRAR